MLHLAHRKPNYIVSTLIMWALFTASHSLAATTALDPDATLEAQRQLYQDVEQAIAKGQWNKVDTLKKQLINYPLYPYIDYADLRVNMSIRSANKIRAFLEQYPDTPMAARLQDTWLDYLQRNNHWQRFLLDYNNNSSNTSHRCYYQEALYKRGDKDKALEGALALWDVGESQPKACDTMFAKLVSENKIDEAVAWKRYTKAILNHEYALAKYLERFFQSSHYKKLIKNYYSIDRAPEKLRDYDIFDSAEPETVAIIEHGIRHLARKNARVALTHWNHYHQTLKFSASAENRILTALIKGLHEDGDVAASDTLFAAVVEKVDASLIEWRVREALSKLDWLTVATWLKRLPDEYANESEWQYWSARAAEQLQSESAAEVNSRYTRLAQTRTFYGFLASERLKLPFNLNHVPIDVPAEVIADIAKLGGIKRAKELFHLQDMLSARREWHHVTRNFDENQMQAAASLAHQWGWHDRAILALVKASYWNDIDLRFPTPWKPQIKSAASATALPASLLYAIARQESALNPTATSPAGARGFIQVMPATAKYVAKKHKIPYKYVSQLHELETNLAIGSQYYRDMLDRFNNNRILASAAYNAGPHRVDRWLKESNGTLPIDAWIETIPFSETRNYVKNILAFSAIYSDKLNDQQPLLADNERNALL